MPILGPMPYASRPGKLGDPSRSWSRCGERDSLKMTDATFTTKIEERAESEPIVGPMIGLVTRGDLVPRPGEVKGLKPYDPAWLDSSFPPAAPEGYCLLSRRQYAEGIVEDCWVPRANYPLEEPFRWMKVFQFSGWLRGLVGGVKRFFLGTKSPAGPMERITYQRVAKEVARMEREESNGDGPASCEGELLPPELELKKWEDAKYAFAERFVDSQEGIGPPPERNPIC